MKYVAALMVLLLVAAKASDVSNNVTDSRWADGLTAHINDYVDNVVEIIIPFLKENGLDPMELPDFVEGFEVRPILIRYSAWVRFHSGRMTGLRNVARSGNQIVSYFNKKLRVRIQLQFNNLEFRYRYSVRVMRLGPTGRLIGSLNRFRVITDILIDFNNDEIQLQQFSLRDIGWLKVRLRGNLLTDWLVNPLIGVFTIIFDNQIMRIVEINISSALQGAIDNINVTIGELIAAIEACN